MTTEPKSHDTLWLVVTALVICVVGVGSVFFFDHFHFQMRWFFVFWMTVAMFALLVQEFRAQARIPKFAAFIILLALAYGATVAFLMRWIALFSAVFLSLIVIVVGYVLAEFIFGVRPTRKIKKP